MYNIVKDGMNKLIITVFLVVTVSNILFDFIFNRLSMQTVAWEGGLFSGLLSIFVLYNIQRSEKDS